MSPAKIQLSAEELLLVQNAEILLTKNRIIERVYELFGKLADSYRERIRDSGVFDEMVMKASPKISRGENYQGLPWVMLDLPRYFTREDVCSIRTMFWWGHVFSLTLHLKGRYQKQYSAVLARNSEKILSHFSINNGVDEWQHEDTGDNYIPIRSLDAKAIKSKLFGDPFIKIHASVPVGEWNDAAPRLNSFFEQVVSALEN